jgi:hypothetical protein
MDQSNYKASLSNLAKRLGFLSFPEERTGLDVYLPLLEKIRLDGAVIVLKLDGERIQVEDNGPYTAVISGQMLKGEYFRIDAYSLEDALDYVIVNYACHQWGIDRKNL